MEKLISLNPAIAAVKYYSDGGDYNKTTYYLFRPNISAIVSCMFSVSCLESELALRERISNRSN